MVRLEERIKTIIETVGTFLRRLQPEAGQAAKTALGFGRLVEPNLAHVDPSVMVASVGNDSNGR